MDGTAVFCVAVYAVFALFFVWSAIAAVADK